MIANSRGLYRKPWRRIGLPGSPSRREVPPQVGQGRFVSRLKGAERRMDVPRRGER